MEAVVEASLVGELFVDRGEEVAGGVVALVAAVNGEAGVLAVRCDVLFVVRV